jgi:hypothetical protein
MFGVPGSVQCTSGLFLFTTWKQTFGIQGFGIQGFGSFQEDKEQTLEHKGMTKIFYAQGSALEHREQNGDRSTRTTLG